MAKQIYLVLLFKPICDFLHSPEYPLLYDITSHDDGFVKQLQNTSLLPGLHNQQNEATEEFTL